MKRAGRVELQQLIWFRVVARIEHMTRAAEELGIAQPSLSKSIRRLEQELGVPLFDRYGRGIRLNRFGAAFLDHADRALRELDAAARGVRELAGLEQGTISLAAGALHWLPEILAPFRIANPGVRFHLSQRSLAELHRTLADGEVDYVFVPAQPPDAHARWLHLQTEEIRLVVPATHRLARRRGVTLAELAGEPMVLGRSGDVLRELMEHMFRRAGFSPEVACEAGEPAAVEEYVAAGLGVAFIPALSRPLPAHPATVSLPITEPACRLAVGIAWYEDRFLSAAARAFRSHLLSWYGVPLLDSDLSGQVSPSLHRPDPPGR